MHFIVCMVIIQWPVLLVWLIQHGHTWSSFVSMYNYIDIMYIKTHDSELQGQEEAAVCDK